MERRVFSILCDEKFYPILLTHSHSPAPLAQCSVVIMKPYYSIKANILGFIVFLIIFPKFFFYLPAPQKFHSFFFIVALFRFESAFPWCLWCNKKITCDFCLWNIVKGEETGVFSCCYIFVWEHSCSAQLL